MPLFTYRATADDGTPREGTIDAADMQSAENSLKEQGLTEPALTPLVAEDIAFATPGASPWQVAPEATVSRPKKRSAEKAYFPIASTVRLYAGWLLAYYLLVYALGWYASTRALPGEIPYVEGLFLSPLVLSFTLAAFLFLLLHSIHRATGGGLWRAIALSIVGMAAFVVYRMNVL